MNRLVLVLFAVCVIFVVEGSMENLFKVCTLCNSVHYHYPQYAV